MNIILYHYHAFQALAFSDRENWRWYVSVIWWYLIVFVWLHQGIFYRNWGNVFACIGDEIQDKYEKYRQRQNMKQILNENPDIAALSKLAGIKNERKK